MTTASRELQTGFQLVKFVRNYGALIGMVAVLSIFALLDRRFLNPKNILGVLNSSTILILMSLGIMMTMAVRGIDLSVAQVADAAAVIVAMSILAGVPIPLAIAVAVGFGLLVGLINCVVISYLGVPAIIGTLGMMFIIRSVELSLTNGAQPQILFTLPPKVIKNFFFIGQGRFGPVTMLIILCAIFTVVLYLVKERSVLGRHMDAVQGNVVAAILSSINIRRVFGATFVISSTLCSIVGVMLVSRSGNAVPRGLESYLTDCFVAVYIGTLLSKNGRFNVIGTVLGALFVAFLGNFITLIGFGAAFKNLFNGVFIILAVALSVLRNRK